MFAYVANVRVNKKIKPIFLQPEFASFKIFFLFFESRILAASLNRCRASSWVRILPYFFCTLDLFCRSRSNALRVSDEGLARIARTKASLNADLGVRGGDIRRNYVVGTRERRTRR